MVKKTHVLPVAMLVGVCTLGLVGCVGGGPAPGTPDKPAGQESMQKNDSTPDPNATVLADGTCDAFSVAVNSGEFTKSKDGKSCITITYTFTNKKSSLTSFFSSITERVMQGDTQLNECDAPQNNDADYDEVESKESIKVVKSFELEGSGPVVVELLEVGKTEPLVSYKFTQ